MTSEPSKTIDFIIHDLDESDESTAVVLIANEVAAKGNNVRLLVLGDNKNPSYSINKNLTIRCFDVKRGSSALDGFLYWVRAYFLLSTFLAKNKSRNIFSWGTGITIFMEIIRITLMLPYKLVGVNNICISEYLLTKKWLVRKILIRIYRIVFKDLNYVITQTPDMKEELQFACKIPEKKITSIYPIISSKFFQEGKKNNQENKILFIGDFVKRTNPLFALEVFSKLEDESAILEMIGEGKLKNKLKEKAQKLGIENRVNFCSDDVDIKSKIAESNLLICTSNYENFSFSTAKAIAQSLPVVSYECRTGMSDIILDGENGYLIRPGEKELFIQKVNQALKNKWDYKNIFELSQKFSPDNLLKNYIEVIRRKLT